MKTVKMSLANLQGKMSRKEMKDISGGEVIYNCWRTKNGYTDTFTTSSSDLAGSWRNVWNGFGYSTDCQVMPIIDRPKTPGVVFV